MTHPEHIFTDIYDLLWTLGKREDATDAEPYVINGQEYTDDDDALRALLSSPLIASYDQQDLIKGVRAALREDSSVQIEDELMIAFITLYNGYGNADCHELQGIFSSEAAWAEAYYKNLHGGAPYENLSVNWESTASELKDLLQARPIPVGRRVAVFIPH